MICHICGHETDFTCDECKEPVCEDCCVVMTIHNHIDYPLCTPCGDARDDDRRREWERENAKAEAANKLKEERRKKARANYWKPENVEKRAARNAERKRQQAELRIKQLTETARIVSEMFRGF